MKTMSLTETKNSLSAVVDEVEAQQESIAITRNGKPAAYLVSAQQWEELNDTGFWLSYPGIVESLAASRYDIAAGRTYGPDEIEAWVAAGMPDEAE